MIDTLRNRNFALVWIAGLISLIGNYMLFIALPLYIYQLTESTLATSIMFAAGIIPRLLVGSVAGVFVDRWDRKKIMVTANVLLGIGLLPLMLVNSTQTVWIIYLVQIFEALVGQFLAPAEGALLPTLVDEDHLMSGNALNSLNSNLARLIGPALGALVVGTLHLSGVVIIDAVSFFAAALLVALITASHAPKEILAAKTSKLSEAAASLWRDWLEGFRIIRQNHTLTLLFIVATLPQIGEGVFSTLMAPFVTNVLGGHEMEYGYFLSAQAIGGLVGGLIIGSMVKKVTLYRVVGIGALGLGIIDLIIFNYSTFIPGILPAIILMAVVGIPAVGYGMALSTMLQTATSDSHRGRILATFATSGALLRLIGTMLAGALGEKISIVTILNIQGIGFVIVGIIALIAFGRVYQTYTVSTAPGD